MAKNKVEIQIKAEADKASRELKKFSKDTAKGLKDVKKESGDLSASMGKLKTAIGVVAAAFAALKGLQGVTRFLKSAGEAAEKEEWALRGLHTVLISMKRDVDGFEQSLVDLADALQKQTGYGNESILMAAKFLSTYKEITNDVMPRALKLTLDIARGWGVELRSAANMVGKAAMGMTGELRRYGITVDQDVYKSRGFLGVMEQIEDQVAGQAEAFRETTTGLKEYVASVWGDVKEQFGFIINQVLDPFRRAVGDVLSGLADKLKKWREGVDLKTYAAEAAEKFKQLAFKVTNELIPALDPLLPKLEKNLTTIGNIFGKISSSYENIKDFIFWDPFPAKEKKKTIDNVDEVKTALGEVKTEMEIPVQPEIDIAEATKSTAELHAEWERIKRDMESKPIHIRIVKETIYTGGEGETEYGYRKGGFVRKQRGGLLPGYGGGDRIPMLAESGEYVLRKEAVQAIGAGVLNAMNRGIGQEKGYFVLDHRFEGGKSFPIKVSADEVGKALVEYIKHSEQTKSRF